MDIINVINSKKSKKSINSWIIYTKSNCSYCSKLKEFISNQQIYTIINCDDWLKNEFEKEIFLQSIKNHIGYEYNTFPMVFLHEKFIGGYTDTIKYFETLNECCDIKQINNEKPFEINNEF